MLESERAIVGGQNYRDLIVWQKAMDFVCEIYRVSQSFPSDERFALTSQLRRAAVSIPANIAEGQGRTTKKEFANFLSIAHGSLREVETLVLLSERLAYLAAEPTRQSMDSAAEIGRLLNGLIKSLRSDD